MRLFGHDQKIPLFKRTTHWQSLLIGVLLMIWSVDTRSVFELYTPQLVHLLKGYIACSFAHVGLHYIQNIYGLVIVSLYSRATKLESPWIFATPAYLLLLAVNSVSVYLTFKENRESYRAILYITTAALAVLCMVSSVVVIWIVLHSLKNVQNTTFSKVRMDADSKSLVQRSVVYGLATFLLCVGSVFLTFQVIRNGNNMTVLSNANPEQFNANIAGIMFVCAMIPLALMSRSPITSEEARTGTLHKVSYCKRDKSLLHGSYDIETTSAPRI